MAAPLWAGLQVVAVRQVVAGRQRADQWSVTVGCGGSHSSSACAGDTGSADYTAKNPEPQISQYQLWPENIDRNLMKTVCPIVNKRLNAEDDQRTVF